MKTQVLSVWLSVPTYLVVSFLSMPAVRCLSEVVHYYCECAVCTLHDPCAVHTNVPWHSHSLPLHRIEVLQLGLRLMSGLSEETSAGAVPCRYCCRIHLADFYYVAGFRL